MSKELCQTYLHLSDKTLLVFVQLVLAEGPFFTGTTLKLRANRGLSPDFDFLRAIAGVHEVRMRWIAPFRLQGPGQGNTLLREIE